MFIVINIFKVDLKLKAEAGDLGTYTNNGEWDLLSEPKIFSKYQTQAYLKNLKKSKNILKASSNQLQAYLSENSLKNVLQKQAYLSGKKSKTYFANAGVSE